MSLYQQLSFTDGLYFVHYYKQSPLVYTRYSSWWHYVPILTTEVYARYRGLWLAVPILTTEPHLLFVLDTVTVDRQFLRLMLHTGPFTKPMYVNHWASHLGYAGYKLSWEAVPTSILTTEHHFWFILYTEYRCEAVIMLATDFIYN